MMNMGLHANSKFLRSFKCRLPNVNDSDPLKRVRRCSRMQTMYTKMGCWRHARLWEDFRLQRPPRGTTTSTTRPPTPSTATGASLSLQFSASRNHSHSEPH